MKSFLNVALKLVILCLLFPYSFALVFLQNRVMGPLLRNRTSLPTHLWAVIGRMMRVEYEFTGAELETDRLTVFMPNHISREDFLIGGHLPRTSFMMIERSFDLPVVGNLARAANVVGTMQTQQRKPLDLAQLTENLNQGINMTIFAEGVATLGYEVLRFSAGSAEPLFGRKGVDENAREVALERDVLLQPLALRVKSISGKEVLHDKDAWRPYTTAYRYMSPLRSALVRAKLGRVVITVTVLPALDPKDYASATDLVNHAQRLVRSVVAPEQTTVRTRRIYLSERKFKEGTILMS